MTVTKLAFRGGSGEPRRQPSPTFVLSITVDMCLFPSPLLGGHLSLALVVTVPVDAVFLDALHKLGDSSSSPHPPGAEGRSCEPASHLLRSVSLCQRDSC